VLLGLHRDRLHHHRAQAGLHRWATSTCVNSMVARGLSCNFLFLVLVCLAQCLRECTSAVSRY
jgi:hypothetical protein